LDVCVWSGGPGEDPGHQQELPPGALARSTILSSHQILRE
jgi:hypothetical protein